MNYTIKVTFAADRELTEKEISDLETLVITQVIEPQVDNNESWGWQDAEYTTTNVEISTEKN